MCCFRFTARQMFYFHSGQRYGCVTILQFLRIASTFIKATKSYTWTLGTHTYDFDICIAYYASRTVLWNCTHLNINYFHTWKCTHVPFLTLISGSTENSLKRRTIERKGIPSSLLGSGTARRMASSLEARQALTGSNTPWRSSCAALSSTALPPRCTQPPLPEPVTRLASPLRPFCNSYFRPCFWPRLLPPFWPRAQNKAGL